MEKFQARFTRPPAPPATWEELADLAEFLRDEAGTPRLAPLPADAGAAADLFCRVAAGYDRTAVVLGTAGGDRGTAGLAFQYAVDTGKPRLDAPGFLAAARWLARVGPCMATGPSDPVAALAEGRAALAVLSLEDLARLPRENGAVLGRFGLAPLPGTRPATAPKAGVGPNYVPYFTGGRLGVVRKRCPHPETAFALLAEIGGPERSLELIGDTAPGVGPFRDDHLDPKAHVAWLGYGFDPKRSGDLRDALRHYLAPNVVNPTFGLRGPDLAALTAALAGELREIAAGRREPAEGMRRAAEAWSKHDAAHAADVPRGGARRRGWIEQSSEWP